MKFKILLFIGMVLFYVNYLFALPVDINGTITAFTYSFTDAFDADGANSGEYYTFLQFGEESIRQPLSPGGEETGSATEINFGRDMYSYARDINNLTDAQMAALGLTPEDYDELKNRVALDGRTFDESDVEFGNTYVIGQLTVQNGIWWTDTYYSNPVITIAMETFSANPTYNGLGFVQDALYRGTPNVNNNPYLDADFIYFYEFPEFGSFRILEGYSGAVEILGRFGSLELAGFGEVLTPDTAYVSSSISINNPVPEPATFFMIGLGMFALGAIRLRKTNT